MYIDVAICADLSSDTVPKTGTSARVPSLATHHLERYADNTVIHAILSLRHHQD